MVDRADVESAIMDAQGASAVLSYLQMELMSSTVDGWRTLGMKPREDLCLTVLSPCEYRALHFAMNSLQHTVDEVARLFYAQGT